MSYSSNFVFTHTVFSTKNRFPFLDDPELRGQLHLYIVDKLRNMGCGSITVGGVADHVHVLCTLSKTVSIADMIMNVKRATSLWLKKGNRKLIGFSWQGSYAIFSVDPKRVDIVQSYIERQEQHHSGHSFQKELRSFYKHYNLELDEATAWE